MAAPTRTLRAVVELDVDTLAAEMSNAEGLQFVKDFDLSMGDWDFTLALADHFDKLRAEHAKERAEDAAKRGKR
jgi:hypothetical protein